MKNAKRCIRKSSYVDAHDENIPASHQPFAPTKHHPSMRDVQAERRNTQYGATQTYRSTEDTLVFELLRFVFLKRSERDLEKVRSCGIIIPPDG